MKVYKTNVNVHYAIHSLKDISWTEAGFLTMIIQFNKGSKVCYASNEHFAQVFTKSTRQCSRILTGLKKKGYINIKLNKKESTVTSRTITTTDKIPSTKVTYNVPDSITKTEEVKVQYKPRLKKIG